MTGHLSLPVRDPETYGLPNGFSGRDHAKLETELHHKTSFRSLNYFELAFKWMTGFVVPSGRFRLALKIVLSTRRAGALAFSAGGDGGRRSAEYPSLITVIAVVG